MNEMASRILGNVTKAQEAMGPPPELIGMDIPAAEPDATRVADLDESEFESLGRVPTPMPAASSPWRKDFRPGVTSPDSWPSNLHFDSDDFLDMMWRHKIARPVNALPSMMNFGLSLMDLAKMLDSPSGREQAVEMVYTMAKGAKNFAVEHNVFDGPLTQEGQVFAMGMEEIVATALDKDRSVNDPFGAMLDLMDGAGFLIGGLGDTAALAGRSEKFVKLMRKVRETSRKGDIKEATMLYSRGMRKMREQAVTPERMDLLERRLMERLQALYGRKIADDTPGGEIESLDTRLARGDLVYSYDTPDLKPKYREFWHMPLEGDIPMPHASIEDGIALSIEVYGPDPTPDQIIKSIEVIRTSDPRWRGKKNPVPVGAENVIRNMPLDELRGIYNAARAHALELERVSPGALDRILNWYPEFGKNIRREVGEENFAEAAVVFGITSQQSPVEQNLMDTYWVMNEVRKYLETPGVGMEKMTKAGLRQHLLDAREEVTATHQVKQTLDKLTSDQRKKYAQGVINPTSLARNPQVTYTGGPVSIIQKEYKAFIDGDSIDRIVDFYTSGMFSGDTKTQTYVTTLLHLTQGSGEGFFPWTTMDQHMARIFKIFKEGKEGTTDIGVFDQAGYRAAQYMTAKLAREVGMSHEQMQALLWFYSKNVLAEGAEGGKGVSKGTKAMEGRYGTKESIALGSERVPVMSGGGFRRQLHVGEGWINDFGTWQSAEMATRIMKRELDTRLDKREALLPQTRQAVIDVQKSAFPMSLNAARKMDGVIEARGAPARMTAKQAKEMPILSTRVGDVGYEDAAAAGRWVNLEKKGQQPGRGAALVQESRRRQAMQQRRQRK